MNDLVLRRLALGNVLVGFLAVFLVALLVLGQNRDGIFEAVAPEGQSQAARAEWLRSTYESWWAGTQHLGGVLIYSAIATLGLFVILLQNLIGFICVYLCIAIPVLDEPDVNWSNPDGRYGWKPLATVYQTVTWSVVLHGLGLSLLLFVLGVENFRWVLILWALWVAVLPLYLLLPPLVFRRVASEARRKRSAVLGQLLAVGRRDPDLFHRLQVEDFVTVHRRIADEAVIRPLRMRRFEVGPLIIGVVLPLLLTVAQTVLSYEFGQPR